MLRKSKGKDNEKAVAAACVTFPAAKGGKQEKHKRTKKKDKPRAATYCHKETEGLTSLVLMNEGIMGRKKGCQRHQQHSERSQEMQKDNGNKEKKKIKVVKKKRTKASRNKRRKPKLVWRGKKKQRPSIS